MSVAPSFKDFPKLTEPYYKDKKWYIKVQNPKTGTIREVRWYPDPNEERRWKNLKKTLGFDEGYITIFLGDQEAMTQWFREQEACRWHKLWGWYVPSTLDVPDPLPYGIQATRLMWETVAIVETEQLRPEAAIKQAIDAIMYEPSVSQWQGQVGEKLERTLTVKKAIASDSYFGTQTFHLFLDDSGNEYTWTTTAVSLTEGNTYLVKGKVREHITYKASPQTVLTNCRTQLIL